MLVTLPSPYPTTPTNPSTPEILRAKEHTPTPHSSVVFTLDSHLSLLRSLGVRQQVSQATMNVINCTMDYPPPFNPLDQIFQLLKLELMGAFVGLELEDLRFPK